MLAGQGLGKVAADFRRWGRRAGEAVRVQAQIMEGGRLRRQSKLDEVLLHKVGRGGQAVDQEVCAVVSRLGLNILDGLFLIGPLELSEPLHELI